MTIILTLEVKSKEELEDLEKFCKIEYVSKYSNIIGIKISENNIQKLDKIDNIIKYRKAKLGKFVTQNR